MVLNTYYNEPFSNGIEMIYSIIETIADRLVHVFDVRTPSIMTHGRFFIRRQPAESNCSP